jgi:hypothetical protein
LVAAFSIEPNAEVVIHGVAGYRLDPTDCVEKGWDCRGIID